MQVQNRGLQKQRKTAGMVIWMEHSKNTGEMPRSYANECKRDVRLDVEILWDRGVGMLSIEILEVSFL